MVWRWKSLERARLTNGSHNFRSIVCAIRHNRVFQLRPMQIDVTAEESPQIGPREIGVLDEGVADIGVAEIGVG